MPISTSKNNFERPVKVAEQPFTIKWEESTDHWYDTADKIGCLFDDRDVLSDIVVDTIDEINSLKQNNKTVVAPPNVIVNAGLHFFIQESVKTPSIPDKPDTPTVEYIRLIHNTTLLHNKFVEIIN